MGDFAGPRSLRQLLDAVMTVGSDLDLPAMLERIVQSAVDLVDARYGALGVLDETRTRLAQFITVGIDEAGHAAIGDLPEATASSGCSSSMPGRCGCRTCASTRTATGSRPTTRRCGRSWGSP